MLSSYTFQAFQRERHKPMSEGPVELDVGNLRGNIFLQMVKPGHLFRLFQNHVPLAQG